METFEALLETATSPEAVGIVLEAFPPCADEVDRHCANHTERVHDDANTSSQYS